MKRFLDLIEPALAETLSESRPKELFEALRYAVGTGGKRIRPVLCLASAEAVGGRAEDALWPACAIELLHNYTLIHDDLPCMDNDVERRGLPSVWKKFGEGTALLAGDALQALAFGTAAKAPHRAAEVVTALGEAAAGVVRGQVEDVADAPVDVDFVYLHKTADLFVAAAKMGALAGGGSAAEVSALAAFAQNLGLAFQFEDDLLDGDFVCPKEETERRAAFHTQEALAALARLRGETAFLRQLAARLLVRRL